MHDCDITATLALSCHAATPLTQAQTATGVAARDVLAVTGQSRRRKRQAWFTIQPAPPAPPRQGPPLPDRRWRIAAPAAPGGPARSVPSGSPAAVACAAAAR